MQLKNKDVSSSVLWWGILVLFTYISLLPFYYLSWISIQIPRIPVKFPLFKYLPLIIILAMSGFFMTRMFKAGSLKISYINLAIYLFTGLTLFSGIGLPYYYVSLAKALYYFISGALLYFLVVSIDPGINKIRRFFQYAVILASLVAAYGIITFASGNDFLFGKIYSQNALFPQSLHFNMGRILSSLGHPVFLGSYLAILSPLFLFNLYSCRTRRRQFIAWALYLIIMLAILLTFSGGAYLAFIIANSILIFLLQKRQLKPIPKPRLFCLFCPSIILAIFFSIIMLTIMLDNQTINNVIFKLSSLLSCGRIKFEELLNLKPLATRMDSLKIAGDILKTNPVFGIGIGRISSGSYVLNKFAVDNMYLSFVSESGLIGLMAFLFLNFVIFKKLLNHCKNLPSGEDKLMLLTLFTCLVAFLVDSFYWDTLYHPTIRLIYWLIIAMSMVIIRHPNTN
jgi:O-antigen ligase